MNAWGELRNWDVFCKNEYACVKLKIVAVLTIWLIKISVKSTTDYSVLTVVIKMIFWLFILIHKDYPSYRHSTETEFVQQLAAYLLQEFCFCWMSTARINFTQNLFSPL